MRIERITVRLATRDASRSNAESVADRSRTGCAQPLPLQIDSGERALGDIVLVYGGELSGGGAAVEAISAFVREALLQLVDGADAGSEALPRPITGDAVYSGGILHCRTEGGRSFELQQTTGGQWALSNGVGGTTAADLGLGFPVPPADSTVADGPDVHEWPGYRRRFTVPPVELTVVTDAPVRAVESRLDQVRASLDESAALERRRGELDQTLQELRSQRARAVELRSAARHKLRRISHLRPVQFHLQQLDRWRQQAGDVTQLRALPEDPGRVLEQFSTRLDALRGHQSAREQAVQSLQATLAAFGARQRDLLQREDEIDELLRRAARIPEQEQRRARLEAADRKVTSQLAALVEQWRESDAGEPIPGDDILAADPQLLSDTFDQLDESRTLRRACRRELERHQSKPAPAIPPLPWVPCTAIAGLATIPIVIWFALTVLVVSLATVAAGIIGVVIALWWGRRREAERQAAEHLSRSVALEAETRAFDKVIRPLELTIRDELEPLGVCARALEEPQRALVAPVESAQRAVLEQRDTRAERALLDDEIAQTRRSVAAVAQELAEWEPAAQPVAALREALIDAHERRARAEQAQHENQRLAAEIKDLRERQGAVKEQRRALQERLRKLAPDYANACRVVRERHRALHAAEWLEAHLQRDIADLDALRAELSLASSRGEEWLTEDDAVANLTRLTESLDDEMIELDRAVVEVRLELEVLRGRPRTDALHRRAVALERDLEQMTTRQDELRRITSLLADADREFVSEHQPAIVARANEYLWRIVGCDPEHLSFLAEDESGELRVTGTRDADVLGAARLALRLALIEQLDDPPAEGSRETLPLLVGDPAALRDEAQRRRALAVLREVSQERQVFIFCESAQVLGLPAVRDFRCDRRVAVSNPVRIASPGVSGWRGRLSALTRHWQATAATPPAPVTPAPDDTEEEVRSVGRAMKLISRVAERLRVGAPRPRPAVPEEAPSSRETQLELPLSEPTDRRAIRTPRLGQWATTRQLHRGRGGHKKRSADETLRDSTSGS